MSPFVSTRLTGPIVGNIKCWVSDNSDLFIFPHYNGREELYLQLKEFYKSSKVNTIYYLRDIVNAIQNSHYSKETYNKILYTIQLYLDDKIDYEELTECKKDFYYEERYNLVDLPKELV